MYTEAQIRKLADRGYSKRYRWLDRHDLAEAIRQLDAGEPLEAVNRRLHDWNYEAKRVANCESREAARIEDAYYR